MDNRFAPRELTPRSGTWVLRRNDRGLGINVMSWDVLGGQAKWPMTNVRNLSLPQWRRLAERPENRCLIPLTEFCEWTPEVHDVGGGRPIKGEMWFQVSDQPIFAMADFWQATAEGAGFAMITRDPNELVAPTHPKAVITILEPGRPRTVAERRPRRRGRAAAALRCWADDLARSRVSHAAGGDHSCGADAALTARRMSDMTGRPTVAPGRSNVRSFSPNGKPSAGCSVDRPSISPSTLFCYGRHRRHPGMTQMSPYRNWRAKARVLPAKRRQIVRLLYKLDVDLPRTSVT